MHFFSFSHQAQVAPTQTEHSLKDEQLVKLSFSVKFQESEMKDTLIAKRSLSIVLVVFILQEQVPWGWFLGLQSSLLVPAFFTEHHEYFVEKLPNTDTEV